MRVEGLRFRILAGETGHIVLSCVVNATKNNISDVTSYSLDTSIAMTHPKILSDQINIKNEGAKICL